MKKNYIPNVNKYRENNHNSRCPCKCCESYFLLYLSFLVKSFEEEIQLFGDCVNITRS